MQIFFKRGALRGPFYEKGVNPHLKKVKRLTFKAHWRLNLALLLKFGAQNKTEIVYLMQIFSKPEFF